MLPNTKKYYSIILITFALSILGLVAFNKQLTAKGFDVEVIRFGNLLLFLVTCFSLFLLIKGMYAKNTTNFLKAVYGSMLGKLFICGIAAFIYFKTASVINKPAIYVILGLYLIYAYLEIKALNQLTRDKKNAERESSI